MSNLVSKNTLLRDILGCVESAEVIDAEPVIHARWVNNCGTRCSSCGERLPTIMYTQGTYDGPRDCIEEIDPTPYCPNCGAKMEVSV